MSQQKVPESQITDDNKTVHRRHFWIGIGVSALSGVLIALSMPNFDVSFLAWLALVPLLLAIELWPEQSPKILAMPFGLIWSIAVHNWYPDFFGPVLGYLLIFAVGSLYASLITGGIALQRRLPGVLKLLALPVLWAAFEFLKSILPLVKDWWIVSLAKSQWQFPPAMQILSVTGFVGLTFLIMLANVALTFLLLKALRERRVDWPSLVALGAVAAVVGWGALTIPSPPIDTFTIAVTVDMANQDPAIQAHSQLPTDMEGYYADTPEMSQAILDVNAELTRAVADQELAFVVWPENEFADIDDERFTGQLGDLAQETEAYLVADMVWHAPTGMHDTALMINPDGNEVGRRAKINITGAEKEFGFAPGPEAFPVFDTPYGSVGIAVCQDRHLPWITRELARVGAQIVLMPVDDDFHGNAWFPVFHASDGVFRAVENRVPFGLSTTSGISLVVDPYGRTVAESGLNERTVITGRVFTVTGQTLYTRWGDWFGWLMVVGLAAMVAMVVVSKRRGDAA